MILKDVLKDAKTIAIGGHIRPDGDCVGSCLGLYQYLKQYTSIETDVYLETFSDVFNFMKATKDVKHTVKPDAVYDLFICLDCSDDNRLGFSKELYNNAKRTVCIDHHISNLAFAMDNYINPEASSSSELVYNLLEKDKITKEIAESLFVGIIHDTGVFQYTNTSPETMEAGAALMKTGIDASKIIEKTFYEKTYVQNQILGRSLLESILLMDGKCIASVVTQKELDFYNVEAKDLEGIVSQLRVTKGVDVAIFLYELQPQEFKVSLRSNENVDVSRIAQIFNGGGHKKAAGFSMKGSAHDVINNIAHQIENQLS